MGEQRDACFFGFFSTDGFSSSLGGNVLASNKRFFNDGFPKRKKELPPSTQMWILSGRVRSNEAETETRFPAGVIASVWMDSLQLQQAGGHRRDSVGCSYFLHSPKLGNLNLES